MMFGQYLRREADEVTERTAGDDGGRRGWQQHRSCFLASTVNPIGVREAPVPKLNKSTLLAAFLIVSPLRRTSHVLCYL